MTNKTHLFGSDYEGKIEKVDGKLNYSLAVDSGFVSLFFTFEIEELDFEVLRVDPYRNAVLCSVLHELIQRTSGAGPAAKGQSPSKFSQAQFREVTSKVLFSSDSDLNGYIRAFSKDYHIALKVFIDRRMKK